MSPQNRLRIFGNILPYMSHRILLVLVFHMGKYLRKIAFKYFNGFRFKGVDEHESVINHFEKNSINNKHKKHSIKLANSIAKKA